MSTALKDREPVIITAGVGWLFTNVGALVVEQWHLMGAEQWSALTSALVPLVTAVVLFVGAWLLRRKVTPFVRAFESDHPAVIHTLEDVTGVDVDQVLAEAEAIFPSAKPDPEPEPAD